MHEGNIAEYGRARRGKLGASPALPGRRRRNPSRRPSLKVRRNPDPPLYSFCGKPLPHVRRGQPEVRGIVDDLLQHGRRDRRRLIDEGGQPVLDLPAQIGFTDRVHLDVPERLVRGLGGGSPCAAQPLKGSRRDRGASRTVSNCIKDCAILARWASSSSSCALVVDTNTQCSPSRASATETRARLPP